VHALMHTSLLLERSASQRVVGDCESAAIDGTYGSLDEGKRAQEPRDGQGGLKYDAVGILTVVAAAASARTKTHETAAPQGGARRNNAATVQPG